MCTTISSGWATTAVGEPVPVLALLAFVRSLPGLFAEVLRGRLGQLAADQLRLAISSFSQTLAGRAWASWNGRSMGISGIGGRRAAKEK